LERCSRFFYFDHLIFFSILSFYVTFILHWLRIEFYNLFFMCLSRCHKKSWYYIDVWFCKIKFIFIARKELSLWGPDLTQAKMQAFFFFLFYCIQGVFLNILVFEFLVFFIFGLCSFTILTFVPKFYFVHVSVYEFDK
jgi:hypothetical protein